MSTDMPISPNPVDDECDGWAPIYFAFNLAEAEYIVSYLDSSSIEAESEPHEERQGCFWVCVREDDAPAALQVVAEEREGKLDKKGMEAIRTAMGFSGGQLVTLTVWSLLLLALLVIAATCFGR